MRKKIYGSYQESKCPFCGKTATVKNKQQVPVCRDHTNSVLEDIKCICGEWMSVRTGKYGAFFLCDKCGPMNLNKALEIKEMTQKKEEKKVHEEYQSPKKEKEITITTDDVEYF